MMTGKLATVIIPGRINQAVFGKKIIGIRPFVQVVFGQLFFFRFRNLAALFFLGRGKFFVSVNDFQGGGLIHSFSIDKRLKEVPKQ